MTAEPSPTRRQRLTDDIRKQILQIPGVGKGSPTDADWQKVGELCLGPTKANVAAGEFKGVELTFMGLNNQNLHNFLFRGFLKPWEAYTGAKITWIDLAQADYNPRLQQAIATGTVDFDMLEMGAPFEGDVCGKGLASEMPDWVKKQIDYDDYVDYLKPPVGTWNGKTYRITIDGDCHNFNYRTDYFSDPDLAKAWKAAGNTSEWARAANLAAGAGRRPSSSRARRSAARRRSAISTRRRPGAASASTSSAAAPPPMPSIPDDKAWLFDIDTMKPRINNPAWVRAIQDVIDALPSEPADQLNADPNTTGFQEFLSRHRLDVHLVGRHRLDRQHQRHLGHRRRGRLRHPAGLGRRLQLQDRQMGEARERAQLRAELRLSRLGRLRHGAGRQRREEAQGGLERGGPPRRQGPVALDRDVSVGLPGASAEPFEHRRMGRRRLQREVHHRPTSTRSSAPTTTRTGRSSRASPASSSITASRRTNWPRSSPARRPRRPAPTTIAAAWEKITDTIGRDKQIALYKASLGL